MNCCGGSEHHKAGRSKTCRTLTGPLTFISTHKDALRLMASFGDCTSHGQLGENPEDHETASNEEVQQGSKCERAAV